MLPQLYISVMNTFYSFDTFNTLGGTILVRCPIEQSLLYEFALALCLDLCRRRQPIYYFVSPVGIEELKSDFQSLCPQPLQKFFCAVEYEDYEDLEEKLVELFRKSPRKRINALVDSIDWLQVLDEEEDYSAIITYLGFDLSSKQRQLFILGHEEVIGNPLSGCSVIDLPEGAIVKY